MMNVGEVLYGFRIDRVRELPEIDAKLWEMEHLGCGARLVWLDRKDENKTFSIAFKTLPEDSTGVFHILEHSVLCGSDKYPVKEPFVELLKSSVQTFLNALTYPDKTVYPVSSRNDRDFLNLTDVYLDAVFHPAIYRLPEIFRQEGWRFEQNADGTYCRQGVVLNEMKGSYSSPESLLWHEMMRLMYPDNCYRFSSGGDPERIPDLTYEQFIEQHRKYYHPSNARIALCGSVPLEDTLKTIDGYLRAYARRDAEFPIPAQTPRGAEERVLYEIGADEAASEKTVFACGTVICRYDEQKELFAAFILSDYLAGDNEAPLKRAILQAGLGQDVRVEVGDGLQQLNIDWEVWNSDPEKCGDVRRVIRETLTDLADNGLDAEALRASYNRFAFRQRDRDRSGTPRSLKEAVDMLDSWLYGGDPAQPLLVEDALRDLQEHLTDGYFESLLRKWFLENENLAYLTLIPSQTLGEERRNKEAEQIASLCGAWSAQRREEQQKQAERLTAWQASEDTPEALATIPMLRLSDLAPAPQPLPADVTRAGDTTVLRHRLGNPLCYCKLFFNASDLSTDDLFALSFLTEVLGQFATEHNDRSVLRRKIKQNIGKLDFDVVPLSDGDPKTARVLFSAFAVCLSEQLSAAADLVTEILTATRWNDRELLRDILKQTFMDGQTAMIARGTRFAMVRAEAYQSALGAAKEAASGFSYLARVKEQIASDDAGLDAFSARLSAIAARVFTADRLTVSVSQTVPQDAVDRLIASFPRRGESVPQRGAYPLLPVAREGIRIPAGVGFAARSAHLARFGKVYNGQIAALENVLRYSYLWNAIRVRGGAYGCGFGGRDDGFLYYYTFRDPSPARSADCFDGAADFLRSFCAANPDLTGHILGAVSDLDPLLNAEEKMDTAERRYFKGITYADSCRRYEELLGTMPKDLLAFCDVLDGIAREKTLCVVGGQAQLDACGDRLEATMSL